MDLTSKSTIRKLLKSQEIRPLKQLGQNFLIGKGVIKKVMEAADIKPNDVILEIGPGLGTLTVELAKLAKKVIACEKDPNMTRILKNELRIMEIKNVEIIQGDILKINPKAYNLKPKTYKAVANLPFYLTAPVIRKFLESGCQPKEMILMVQKEVGQRICSRPPDMNLLAVSVQIYAKPEIISYISKKSFWPQPKVDSAIIKIVPRKAAPHQYLRYDAGLREQFFKIVRSGFSQPRKQLLNNLSKGLKLNKEKVRSWLLKNNIQPVQRAETLFPKDWLNLLKSYHALDY